MQSNRNIYSIFLIALASVLASCDYFTMENQLLRNVNGIYGLGGDCYYASLGERSLQPDASPYVMVIDFYSVDDRACGIKSIEKDGNGFVLNPIQCSLSFGFDEDTSSMLGEIVKPFSIRVEAKSKNEIIFQEIGKDPVTLRRCSLKPN